jgi:hypothetical protein
VGLSEVDSIGIDASFPGEGSKNEGSPVPPDSDLGQEKLRSEIQMTKVVLDFVDNPQKLWRHLKPQFRNLFIECLVVEKQALRLTHNRPHLSLQTIIDYLADLNDNSRFAKFLVKKLCRFKTDHLGVDHNFGRHLKQILRESFKGYFLDTFSRAAAQVSDDPRAPLIDPQAPLMNDELRKNSKIINFDVPLVSFAQPKNKQEVRLEKVDDFGPLF